MCLDLTEILLSVLIGMTILMAVANHFALYCMREELLQAIRPRRRRRRIDPTEDLFPRLFPRKWHW